MRENSRVTRIPDVLAARYASAPMNELWSPAHKVHLERQLWLTVLRAQRDLGIAVPDGVIEAYEAVATDVDLDSIAARERVTRHDVKARIDEFSAQAGQQHIHKGMTSRDLTENVEQLQVRESLLIIRDRMVATLARLARLAVEYQDLVITGRTHNVPAQATTLGKRFASAADELLVGYERISELLIRYPLRGIKGPVGTSQDQLDLLSNDAALVAELERRVAEHLGCGRTRPGRCSAVESGKDNPADGRPGTRHRGIPRRSGRVQRHATQDEYPVLRTGKRACRRPAWFLVHGW
jgi:adenylosuccinate lyase